MSLFRRINLDMLRPLVCRPVSNSLAANLLDLMGGRKSQVLRKEQKVTACRADLKKKKAGELQQWCAEGHVIQRALERIICAIGASRRDVLLPCSHGRPHCPRGTHCLQPTSRVSQGPALLMRHVSALLPDQLLMFISYSSELVMRLFVFPDKGRGEARTQRWSLWSDE